MHGRDDLIEPGQTDMEHLAVQKQESGLRLRLSCRRNAPFDSQVAQKGAELGCSEVPWMPLAVEVDVTPGPVDIGLLGAIGVVPGSDFGSQLV